MALGASIFAGTAEAQHGAISPQCAADNLQDACQKTVDLFHYMVPQFGMLAAGGNATPGQGQALGGLGKFSIGVQAIGMDGSTPQVDPVTVSPGPARSDFYGVNGQLFGLPQVDAAVGVLKGMSVGRTNIGAVDILLSAQLLASFNTGSLKVTLPNGPIRFGGGLRLGLLQETNTLPGLAVTYFRRSLPTASITGFVSGDSLDLKRLGVTTDAWRLVASKTLSVFGFTGGIGTDSYSARSTAHVYVTQAASAEDVPLHQSLTRANAFFDLSINFPGVKLVGEIGRAADVKVDTYNTFHAPAGEGKPYGSVGLTFGRF